MFKSKKMRHFGPLADPGVAAPAAFRCLSAGVRDLAPVELLTLALGGGSAPPAVAANVLGNLGGVGGLAEADALRLARMPGLGPALALRLVAAFELGARIAGRVDEPGASIRGPGDLHGLLLEEFRGRDRERFLALHLDTRHRLRAIETVSVGSLGASLVHPREVFRTAVRRGTAALVVAHNHPSGCPEPSREDLELTARLAECGRLMGIEVLDHVIVGSGVTTSLRERGWPDHAASRSRAADTYEG